MSEAIPRKRPPPSRMRRATSKREINDEDLIKIGETGKFEINFDAFGSYIMKSTREAIHFMHSCDTCRCLLRSEDDIYIYRGDRAFCSIGCREKYMQAK